MDSEAPKMFGEAKICLAETMVILLFQGADNPDSCAHFKLPPFFVLVDLSQSTNLLHSERQQRSRQICVLTAFSVNILIFLSSSQSCK